jgi:hypothetical protein
MASPQPTTPFDGVSLTDSTTEDAVSSPVDDLTLVGCIRRFIAVEARLTALSAEEKILKRERAQLSDRVAEMMIEQEMDSPPGVDGMTAYFTPVYYVEKNIDPDTSEEFTSDDVRDALIASNLAAMIKQQYNGNQLRALLKEYDENGTEWPEPLAKVVSLAKRRQLAVTPMAARKQSAAPRGGA